MRVLCLTDFPVTLPDRWIWNYLPDQLDEVDFLWAEPSDRSARLGKLLTRYPTYYRLALQVLQQVQRKDYDLLLAWESKVGVPMALVKRISGRRTPPLVILAFAAGDISPVFHPVVRLGLGAVDHVTVLTKAEAASYQTLFSLPTSKISCAPLGAYDVRDEAIRLASAGQVISTSFIHASGRSARDYATLIRAAEGLGTRVVIHGRGYNFKGLAGPANVEIGELVPREQFYRLALDSLFEVVPLQPIQHPVGSSQIVFAMMMGKAVVATRNPFTEEFVEDGVTGLLVKPQDVAEMRAAIQYLVDNPSLTREMGLKARARYEAYYTFDVFARSTYQILHDRYSPASAIAQR